MRPTRPLKFPEFVTLVAVLFSTIALSVDAMLPALPVIAAELSPDAVNSAQLVVTSFLLGLGLGTLVAGPLSDSLGRRRVIVAGLLIYGAAALWAAYAQSLEALLAARVMMGIGAAGPRTVTLAMVRDLYEGRRMAQVMSIAMTLFVLVPAVAPALGQLIISLAGWRAVFIIFGVFGAICLAWFGLRQPETLPPSARRKVGVASFIEALREVLGNRVVVLAILVLTLGFSQMFAYLSSVQQIFDITYGRGETFPLYFAGIALVAGSSGFLNALLVRRLGMRRLASAAFRAQLVASIAMLAALLGGVLGGAEFAVFYAWSCGLFFITGFTFGNLNALAMEPMGHVAGMAAALIGAISTVAAVVLAVPIGLAFAGTPLPVVAGAVICSGLAVLLMRRVSDSPPAAPLAQA